MLLQLLNFQFSLPEIRRTVRDCFWYMRRIFQFSLPEIHIVLLFHPRLTLSFLSILSSWDSDAIPLSDLLSMELYFQFSLPEIHDQSRLRVSRKAIELCFQFSLPEIPEGAFNRTIAKSQHLSILSSWDSDLDPSRWENLRSNDFQFSLPEILSKSLPLTPIGLLALSILSSWDSYKHRPRQFYEDVLLSILSSWDSESLYRGAFGAPFAIHFLRFPLI